MSTRFNKMNCWPQCRKCNWLEQGKDAEYRKFLLEKIGENELNKLEYLKTQTKKWTRFELELLIEHYKEEIKKLNAN
jgi:hypothetical protein